MRVWVKNTVTDLTMLKWKRLLSLICPDCTVIIQPFLPQKTDKNRPKTGEIAALIPAPLPLNSSWVCTAKLNLMNERLQQLHFPLRLAIPDV
jgi:hypothetical protein